MDARDKPEHDVEARVLHHSLKVVIRSEPSKRPLGMQHFLKSASGAADAEIVAAQLFVQFDIAMDDADAALHAGFGRVGLPTLARDLKRTAGR